MSTASSEQHVRVLELVDKVVSKTADPSGRVGSTPTPDTKQTEKMIYYIFSNYVKSLTDTPLNEFWSSHEYKRWDDDFIMKAVER